MRFGLRSQLNIEEVKLIAWHHMLQDPYLQTYEVDDCGQVINHRHVNPDLAYQRAVLDMLGEVQEIGQEIMDALLPAFEGMVESMDKWYRSLEQSGLVPRLSKTEPVDLGEWG